MKILTIIGARPQFVKAAVLSRLIQNNVGTQEIIVHTGQHFDANMSDVFFEEMGIRKPDYRLNIHGLDHGAMTGRMMEEIEKILKIENPEWVLVYGDTNSTLAGALAAKKLHFKIAHVEAGLRSFNMKMPEEINRILTDRISDILFCPTRQSQENLQSEGYGNFNVEIKNVGDIMYDAALFYSQKIKDHTTLPGSLFQGDYALVTIHRAENTDDKVRLGNIVEALNEINRSVKVVLPIHPRTKSILEDSNIPVEFKMIDPVGYFDMLKIIMNSQLVFTDSGGLQKEAYFFKKFCITLRDETEWVELVKSGFNVCVGADKTKIVDEFNNYVKFKKDLVFSDDLYGKGNAGELILQALQQFETN